MLEAESILERAVTERVSSDWRARVFELAEALYRSIGMQLSVPLYQAEAVDRGANLDNIDVPVNDRLWLKEQFAEIRELPDEGQRLKRIDDIVHWTDPGRGGFYDDLGDLLRQPHLVRLALPQGGAALDVGEQKGDGAGRQVGHQRSPYDVQTGMAPL